MIALYISPTEQWRAVHSTSRPSVSTTNDQHFPIEKNTIFSKYLKKKKKSIINIAAWTYSFDAVVLLDFDVDLKG